MKPAITVVAAATLVVMLAIGANLMFQGVNLLDAIRATPKGLVDYFSTAYSDYRFWLFMSFVGVVTGVAYVNVVPRIKTRR